MDQLGKRKKRKREDEDCNRQDKTQAFQHPSGSNANGDSPVHPTPTIALRNEKSKSLIVRKRTEGVRNEKPPLEYQGKIHAFPFKLHSMLEDATKLGFDSNVSWVHDGMAFKIHNRDNFAKSVLPRYFSQTQYKSFQRQLNLYNFQRTEFGPYIGAYSHLYFTRGNPRLCHLIVRSRRSSPGDDVGDKETMADSSSAAVSHAPLRPHPQEYPQVDNSSAVDHPTGRSYRERRKIHENERREKMSSLEVAGDRALHGDYLSNLKKPPNNTTSVNDAKELLFSDFSLLRRASVEVQEEDVEHHGFLFSSPSRGLDMLPHRRRDTSNADSITRFSHPFSSQLIPIGAAGPSLTPSCQIDEENFLPSEEDLEPHNDWDVLRSDESSIQATDIIEEIILTFGSKKP